MHRPAGRGAARLFAWLALTLLITACAAPPPDQSRGATPAYETAAPPAAEADTATATAVAADGTTDKATLQEAKAVAAPPAAVPPEPLPEPGELAGLSDDEVKERLGAPAFVRSDPPAAIWQYRRDGCLLDLYLHASDQRLRVRHFEFRADPQEKAKTDEAAIGAASNTDAKACYAALIRAHGTRAQR